MTLVPYSYVIYSCNEFIDVCIYTNSLIDISCYLSVYILNLFSLNVENIFVLILLAYQALSKSVGVLALCTNKPLF